MMSLYSSTMVVGECNQNITFNSPIFNDWFIMATSFSGGRSQSTQREPPTMGKQLVNFIPWVECTLFCNLQSRAQSELFMVKNVYLGFSSHGFTYWWIYFFSPHCKHVQCNTLTHYSNEDLSIKRKGDPKSRTLSRTSDITETRNPCVIKVILLACSTYIDIFKFY